MDITDLRFADRAEAGTLLAGRVAAMSPKRPVVYALPRGGVPVAVEVSKRLKAPLDLIFVRKIGTPGSPEVALAAVVDGGNPQTVVNQEIKRRLGVDDAYLDRARANELSELERRRARYLGSRRSIDPTGQTAIIVDDGLATGATMKAAILAMRNKGAEEVWVALPVAPIRALEDIRSLADNVICLNPTKEFYGVGGFYHDFHQLTDEETVSLLRKAWSDSGAARRSGPLCREVSVPPLGLKGTLCVPEEPRGLVLFVHGSGSSRFSPRNIAVAHALNARGFASLLMDLLTEEEAADRSKVFDIPLLAERVVEATLYLSGEPDISDLPLGLFGASTGGGAALVAAAELPERVAAVVSRGGRPDLAGQRLADVEAPTLLIVGGNDTHVIELNKRALADLRCEKRLKIVPGAGHLFEEPGTLEQVIEFAGAWFDHYLQLPVQAFAMPGREHGRTGFDFRSMLQQAIEPLPDLDSPGFAQAFDRFGSARIVLLGEASHGTSEFYRARAAITRQLIEHHGFSIVAVEADWPDAAAVDRDIRQRKGHGREQKPFTRFPTWMWRNREFDDFVGFLRRHNASLPHVDRVAFYGLDLYSMHASIAAVLSYLDAVDPKAAAEARARYACLSPWSREPAAYGRTALSRGYAMCENPVTQNLVALLRQELDYVSRDGDLFFDASQNARVVASAERYYRVMYYGSHLSWNLRDQHMFDTLQRILDHAGPDAKAVIWAHNSHIGDARFTEMGTERGELNVGQLCRQTYGKQAALIGFGTNAGTVAAASEWDAPMQVMQVKPSRPDSYEALMHGTGEARFLLDMRNCLNEKTRSLLSEPRLERYIGVIYRPDTERWSHYSFSSLPDQYDGFVWFDQTRAVTPLAFQGTAGEDETYPFGL